MKRKLIVTLVASALELYAASAGAQAAASCEVPGGANFASAVRTGPLNPVDGFPEYVTDANGVSVQRCLDPLACFFDPVIPTDPFSIQIGSGGEAFYWGASSVVFNAAGNRILTVVMAAETAFLQNGPLGEPINGSQFPFLRLRFTMGVPVDGTYTVVHPYGTDVFTVTGATGARDVFSTVDRGFAPNTTLTGSVGPFLKWDPAVATAPVGFLGDGSAAGPSNPVVGSPCGSNFVQVTGVDTAGRPVDFGAGEFVLFSDLFSVQGKIYDGKVQTPLAPNRLTYSRALTGAGQIDSFATSTATATVTVKDGPTIPAGTSKIPTALPLDRTATSATEAIDSLSVVVADAAALPPIVALSAADPTALVPTDATTLNLHLIDFVDISQADYDPATGVLSVAAASGDLRTAPTLTLRDFGAFAAGQTLKLVTTVAPPAVVFVDSSAGGSSSAQVRVIASAAPAAPTALALTSATSLTVTLNWADNSTNESGFKIYQVAADGITRTLLATTAANVKTFTVTGLTAATAYTFQVDAFNGSGAASSNTLAANTLALPVAPSAVASAISPSVSRGIVVSWADNSSDETGFVISRSTTAGGVYAQVATAAAGATSVVDASGPPATATTYFYRVTAVRGVDSSAVAQTAAGVATPAAPGANTAPTFTGVTGASVTVNWARRNTTETGYIVYRAPVVGGVQGAFTAVSGTLGLVTTFTDTTVTANTVYRYRINAVGWASYTPGINGTVSANVTPVAVVTLNAVTALAATPVTGNPPALSWGDASTNETGYRVQRRTVTLSNAGVRTNGAFATVGSPAANATAFTDTAQTANAIVEYSVAALNGATVGPVTNVLAVPGGIPGVLAAPTFTRAGNTVTVNWAQAGTNAANRAGIGGYSVQRCTVTATETCADASAGWAQVASTTGRNNLTATNTVTISAPARTYRYRVVSNTGPNAVTTVTGTASPASANLVR